MDILHQLASELKLKFKERRTTIAETLAVGKATDWADYRYRAGRIKGLDDAVGEIDALMERQEIRE
jgi:hypothetical protein